MPLITIRDATPDDAAGVVAILTPIIEARTFTAFDTPFTVDDERRFIERLPARGIFHVAVDTNEERIVGLQNVAPFGDYTRAFDHVGVIGTYVDLTRRRQGIATQLFEATVRAAAGKGYQKLFAYVRADNPAALAMYTNRGFAVIGTAFRHAKIDGRYIDEILIERWLT